MCGICGEFRFDDQAVVPDRVLAMANAIAHRGPDDAGLYCEGPIGLGHRRLSIIDLSASGHQPMWTADGTLGIVFNGEIYNFAEIRRELEGKGRRFVSASDTEVILAAVQCWGLDAALSRFIGMFAFALWNRSERRLYLVRDRVGIKPLYYHHGPKVLLFGSELKALFAHPGFSRRLNQQGLGQFFVLGYCLGQATVLADTFKLPAGHYAVVTETGGLSLHQYWSLDRVERGSFTGTFHEAVSALESLCDSAFQYRLVSDVPVGVFLSGGIDSTFLAAFLKKRLGTDLEHITIGFNNPAFDESPKARLVAQELGLRHSVTRIDVPDAREVISRFVEIWDEPFGDTSGIPTSILSGVARAQVKVALSADGGDEQFCGYESYRSYAGRLEGVRRTPRWLRSLAATLGRKAPYRQAISAFLGIIGHDGTGFNPQVMARYEKALDVLEVSGAADLIRVMNEKGWTERSVSRLLRKRASDVFVGTVLSATHLTLRADDFMDSMMRTDYSAFLRDDILTKVDRASMAVSLECRDPFLDHRIAEFAFSLPLEYLYSGGEHKRILKHILRRWVSAPVLTAPKRGFVIPLYEWLRGPWRPLVHEHLSAARIRAIGVLDEKQVAVEVERFYRYAGGRAERIMLMLNFQMWAERWYLS